MIILALSDEVVQVLYGANFRERYASADLIVSCGDLPPEYLEYVVSVLNVPLLYVPGNHDADLREAAIRVPVPESIEPEDLFGLGERVVFLERTQLDHIRPDVEIETTLLGAAIGLSSTLQCTAISWR
jgi:predicted phosphodiesterase